jgi:hypothetical protein
MHRLLDLLRGTVAGDVSEAEWMSVLDLAAQENILPWTAARLRPLIGGSMPRLASRLEQIDRSAQISTFVWTATLRSTLATFHRRGIPVISLKGPWLAERLYGDAALRSCRDLDLLVHRSDLARAEALLLNLGFATMGRRDDYHRPWHRNGIIVELHHDVENPLAFDFAIDAAWDRSELSEFRQIPARLLAPPDELLYLCLHGVRHRFERLNHILDLKLAFRRWPVSETSVSQLQGSGFGNIVALGAVLASRLDPDIQVEGLCAGPGRRLRRFADDIWEERMSQQAAPLDWRAQHRFYSQLENPGARRALRRMRHLRILLTRLIDSDFVFAEQFNLRRNWQVWLLRPIRLLLQYTVSLTRTGASRPTSTQFAPQTTGKYRNPFSRQKGFQR